MLHLSSRRGFRRAGGAPKEESVEDSALRLSREIAFAEKKNAFLRSEKGVQTANQQVLHLFSALEKSVKTITNTESSARLEIDVGQRDCAIYMDGFSVYLKWIIKYTNTLEQSALYVALYEGIKPISGKSYPPWTDLRQINKLKFHFDLTKSGQPIWREDKSDKKFYLTQALAKLSLTMLFNKIKEFKFSQNGDQ